MPVADVDEVDRVCGQAAGPVDQLRHRPRGWLGPKEAGRFAVADVQQVGQGIVRADGVDEIALKALRDQDRGHLRCGRKEPTDRLSWPVAGIGRILSPRRTPTAAARCMVMLARRDERGCQRGSWARATVMPPGRYRLEDAGGNE